MEILLDFNINGKTIIMVTHDEDLKKCGNRIINLSR